MFENYENNLRFDKLHKQKTIEFTKIKIGTEPLHDQTRKISASKQIVRIVQYEYRSEGLRTTPWAINRQWPLQKQENVVQWAGLLASAKSTDWHVPRSIVVGNVYRYVTPPT